MNKKIPALSLMALLSPTVFAGTMGPVAEPGFYMFVLGEGNYTWNQANGFDFTFSGGGPNTVIQSLNHENGWGGRLAAGAMKQISATPFFFSGEIGYGYYGSTNLSPVVTGSSAIATVLQGIDVKSSQDGFDALVGAIYNQPMYDLFFKAGALVQNSRLNANANFSLGGGLGTLNFKLNRTQTMPEIKLGGSYHLNDNFAITAAWTHAFGESPQLNGQFNSAGLLINVNLENPTLDVASLGLQYRFA